MKKEVMFTMGAKKNVSLEDAVEALHNACKEITVIDQLEDARILCCSAPLSAYETTFSTKLVEKACTYTKWPTMTKVTHTYLGNISKPKIPKELKPYISFVDEIGGHAHLC
ncbi:hypothetical protein HY639_00520 [Candidatus Woesearchaeota archaeon]|nr:hypothetical protein [Candidatus Woesearchaeota archaeon]